MFILTSTCRFLHKTSFKMYFTYLTPESNSLKIFFFPLNFAVKTIYLQTLYKIQKLLPPYCLATFLVFDQSGLSSIRKSGNLSLLNLRIITDFFITFVIFFIVRALQLLWRTAFNLYLFVNHFGVSFYKLLKLFLSAIIFFFI